MLKSLLWLLFNSTVQIMSWIVKTRKKESVYYYTTVLLLYVQTIHTQSCLCVCTILLLYSNDGTALDRRNREGISVDSQTITKEIRHRKSAILFVLCI